MAIFLWNDTYNGGIAEVDEQHQHLVEMINELDEAFASGVEGQVIRQLYERLAEYCVYHFGTEEKLMEEAHCDPAYIAHHRQAHLDFVRIVGNFGASLDVIDRETIDVLLDYLIKWLLHHTQGEDKEMVRLIRGGEAVLDKPGAEHERFLQRALDQEVAQRHLMSALRESELRFRAVADDVPVLIWLAEKDGRRVFFNRQWLSFTGRQDSEERGDGWLAGVHPEDVAGLRQTLAKALEEKKSYSAEYRLRRADGGYAWFQETGVPRTRKEGGAFSGFVGANFDVTERKRTQHVLELARDRLEERVAERTQELSVAKKLLEADIEERKRFQAEVETLRTKYELILNSAGIGIYGVDNNFNTTFINPAACAMLGWEAKDLLGRGVHNLVHHTHPDGRPYPLEECPIYRAVQEGVARCVEDEVFWRKDGSSFDVEYTITPIFDGERIGGAVVMFSDISARKQAEREVRQSYSALKELNAKLVNAQNQLLQSEKMASIGQLAAGVAHEINNPIGFVNSNLGTLQRYVDDLLRLVDAYDSGKEEAQKVEQEIDLDYLREDIASLVKESRDGVGRVKRIVQDLKDFSHVDEAEWQWSDVNKGLESTLNVVWNEVKYKAEVVKEFGDLPEIYCLPHQLNQVFMNLLINAAQAIEERGVITLRTSRVGDGVRIEIADTGKGIPPELIPRIFEPFFTTKPVGKGTGLGLSLAYGIVEKHKGHIEVASEPGEGTAFSLWLPVKPVEVAEA